MAETFQIAPFPATQIGRAQAQQVLVEAESFEAFGGWKLDTQFIENMGSPYLLAHGLGQPVKDAKTTVTFPEIGEYRVCVDKSGNMDALKIEIELAEGSDKVAVPSALMHSIASELGMRPEVRTVKRGTLPQFEEKAKRFHVKLQ